MTTQVNAIRQCEISGVRTLFLDRPGPTRVALHFGVGWSDETFTTRGVTHAIEHLTMSAVRRGKFDMNASVTALRTTFWATGRTDQVTGFLQDVVAALRALPLDRLDKERGILEAESRSDGYGPHDALLKARYGNQGLGLGIFDSLGPRSTDHEVVGEHLARWFVRENAVLTIAGELPADLQLVLPSGPIPTRVFVEHGRPGCISWDVDDPILSFVTPDSPEALLALRVMASALEESLRHERGLVYGLMSGVTRLPGEGRLVAQMSAQVAPGEAKTVAEALGAELIRRAEGGVTPEEIRDDLEWWDSASADPDFALGTLDNGAERLLCGTPFLGDDEMRVLTAAADPAAVAALLTEALKTVMLLTPRGVSPEDTFPDGGACSVSRELTGTTFRRRLRSSAARGTALGLSDGAVQHRDADGDVHEVRFDECVGLGVHEGCRMLYGARGCFVWVDPKEYRGAAAIVRAIDEGIPAELRFSLSE